MGTSKDSPASASVVISAGAAAKLAFTTQPSGGTGGTAFTTQPAVTVQDAYGNTVTTDTSSVTLAITSGTGTAGAALTCTPNPKAAVSGVVTFTGCQIDKAGTGYTLTATDGTLTSATSTAFNVTVGAAAKLAFTQQPSGGTAGSAISNLSVAVQDAGGNTVTTGAGSTDTITLSIGAGPAGGTFNSSAGTYTNVAASAGVVTFTGIIFNTAGSYTLTAADTQTGRTTLTTASTTPIAITAGTANKLAFVQGPSNAYAGATMTPAPTVQVQDQYGNAVSASGVSVTVTPSAGVVDSGSTASTSATGLATFSAITINTAATGLKLTASAPGLASTAASAAFDVTVLVSNGAALTDVANDGAGSGIQTVAYFYCAGTTGTCTSANWTAIGSSSDASGNYLVNWTGQPSNGTYRLVVIGTDNVNNASTPSPAIPITVSN